MGIYHIFSLAIKSTSVKASNSTLISTDFFLSSFYLFGCLLFLFFFLSIKTQLGFLLLLLLWISVFHKVFLLVCKLNVS